MQMLRDLWQVATWPIRKIRPSRPAICPSCGLDVTTTAFYRHYGVCQRCSHHFRLPAKKWIEALVDPHSFKEVDVRLAPVDPLSFFSGKDGYRKRLKQAQKRTRLTEAVITGVGRIGGVQTLLAVFDFAFMGGSMGSVVGEKITLAFERAVRQELPIVLVTSSGGARIQEGMLALMQMAKTAAAVQRFHAARLPFISVLASPTTGGVYASFANLGDVILAEPGALIGFVGPRVVEATTGEKLPSDSHTAEFLLQHGMIDAIVPRLELQGSIAALLTTFCTREKLSQEAQAGPLADAEPHQRSAWELVKLARHADRPTALDYIRRIFIDFFELHGDRYYGDDPAIVGGVARLEGQAVIVIGQERGHGPEAGFRHHGMARPEGYRKAERLMRLAAHLGLPIITFIDTPGASPGYEAEKRGMAMALANCLGTMAELPTPILSVVIGEGGSGGALALGVADRILMLQNAVYSVISPEGAAAIIFRDSTKAEEIADQLHLTAWELKKLGIIDEIIPEPGEGAHAEPESTTAAVKQYLCQSLAGLNEVPTTQLLEARYEKYRGIGRFKS